MSLSPKVAFAISQKETHLFLSLSAKNPSGQSIAATQVLVCGFANNMVPGHVG